ncbi:MAG: hypothetical protein U0X76_01695 [Bacteroidia bacterium]
MSAVNLSSGKFNISIFSSVAHCSDDWQSGDLKIGETNYLALLERILPGNIQFYYLIVRNHSGKICGKLYFQRVRFGNKNVVPDKNLLVCTAVNVFLKLHPFHILVCGNVVAVNFPSCVYDESEISADEFLQIIRTFEDTIHFDAVVLKDLSKDYDDKRMLPAGYRPYKADLTMTLDIDPHWQTLDGYQKALSKKYRKRMVSIRAAGKDIIRKEMNEEEIGKAAHDLERLLHYVAEKQTIQMCRIEGKYFHEFKKAYPDTFHLFGYYLNGQLIGFTSYIEREPELEFHYIGIDYTFNTSHSIYFNMLFDGIELAQRLRKKELELGRTAREAKANLGCRAVYFNDYIRIKNKTADFLADWIGKRFQSAMGEEWKNRHPFRSNLPEN